MAPRETENNGYAKFWGDKDRALWYVMVFSGVVNWVQRLFENGFFSMAVFNRVKTVINVQIYNYLCT